jgi:hydrogenase maturation protein HypF
MVQDMVMMVVYGGGEVFINDKRAYTFKPIKLIGNETAIKDIKKIALSMLFDKYSLYEVEKFDFKFLKEYSKRELKLLYIAYTKNINCINTSSVGRVFDAIAVLSNYITAQTYEGESGLIIEKNYNKECREIFEYKINKSNQIKIEYDFFDKNLATKFINTLVEIITNLALKHNLKVILCGGVFQNGTLLNLVINSLNKNSIKFYTNNKTSINDNSISIGQAYFAMQTLNKG